MAASPLLAHPAEALRPLVVSVQAQAIVDHLCVIKDEAELRQVRAARQKLHRGRTWPACCACPGGPACCYIEAARGLLAVPAHVGATGAVSSSPNCTVASAAAMQSLAGSVPPSLLRAVFPPQLIADDNEIGGSHRVQLSEIQRILTATGEYFSKAGKLTRCLGEQRVRRVCKCRCRAAAMPGPLARLVNSGRLTLPRVACLSVSCGLCPAPCRWQRFQHNAGTGGVWRAHAAAGRAGL